MHWASCAETTVSGYSPSGETSGIGWYKQMYLWFCEELKPAASECLPVSVCRGEGRWRDCTEIHNRAASGHANPYSKWKVGSSVVVQQLIKKGWFAFSFHPEWYSFLCNANQHQTEGLGPAVCMQDTTLPLRTVFSWFMFPGSIPTVNTRTFSTWPNPPTGMAASGTCWDWSCQLCCSKTICHHLVKNTEYLERHLMFSRHSLAAASVLQLYSMEFPKAQL